MRWWRSRPPVPSRWSRPQSVKASAQRSAKPAKKTAKAPAKTKAAKGKAVAKAKPARGTYGVQVGAFRAAPQARAAMKSAMNRAPDLLRGAYASVGTQKVRNRPLFKATLVGLSRGDAEAACKRLKKQKQDCMVIQAGNQKIASG